MMNIVFADCIWMKNFSHEHGTLSEGWLEECLRMADHDPKSLSKSNIGGYHSKQIKSNYMFRSLFDDIGKEVVKYVEEFGFGKFSGDLSDAWFNINKKGDANFNHIHAPSLVSGVYYLASEGSLSGDLELHSDSGAKKWAMSNQNPKVWGVANQSICRIAPVNNTLILFPSWLEHSVAESQSDLDRVSVSFNYV